MRKISKDLRIQIVAELNKALSTAELQKQLKSIQSELKINIGIGSENIGNIQKQISELQKKINGQGFKIIDDKEAIENINKGKKGIRELYTDIDRAVKRYSELGQVKVDKVFHPVTKELQGFNLQIERANGLVDKLKLDMVKIGDIKGSDAFEVVSRKQIDNTQKILEQQLQQQTRIEQQLTKNKESEKQRTLELQKQLDLYKQQAQLNAQNIRRTHSTTVDNAQLNDYLRSVNDLTVKTPDLENKMKQLNMEFKKVSGNAKEAAGALQQSGMSMVEMVQQGLTKFPIWMFAATMFYQPLRTGKEFIDILVNVDTHLTNLKKVMDDNTDFSGMLEMATVQAKELAKTLDSVLDSYEEFARQGYNQQEIEQMSKAALVASNVGEIDSGKAAEYLTSAIIQLKLETEDAMFVVDAWNEISNKNATTLQKMAEGYARAGSTMYNFGLDMHQANAAIGTVTAATKQSGAEIGNFLKNVLPRLLSQPAQDALEMIDVSIIDSVTGDLKDAMVIYEEVANKFQDLSKLEKAIVTEGLAGKHHISRMTALLDNWDMYEKMLAESMGSAGSAMEENAIFMDSLQAKINLLRADVEMLALSFGEAFMSDALFAFLNTATSALGSLSSIVSTIGGLPTILMATVPVFIILNKQLANYVFMSNSSTTSTTSYIGKLRELVIAKRQLQSSTSQLTGTLGIFTTSTKASTLALERKRIGLQLASTAVRGLTVAFRGLLASTVVGVAFLGIGIILEKLFSAISKANEAQKEYQETLNTSTDSIKNNSENVNELFKAYKQLEEIKNTTGLNNEQQEEYVRIQNELAQLLPTIKIGEDNKGNAILTNSKLIEKEIELLQEKITLEKELARIKAQDTFDDIDSRRQSLDSERESIERQIEVAQRNLDRYEKMGNDRLANQTIESIGRLNLKLQENSIEFNKLESEQESTFRSLFDNIDKLNDTEVDFIKNLVFTDNKTIDEAQEFIDTIAEFKDVIGDTFSIDEIDKFSNEQKGVFQSMSVALKNGYTDWEQWRKALEKAGFSTGQTDTIIKGLEKTTKDFQDTLQKGSFFADAEGKIPIKSMEQLQELMEQGIPVWIEQNGQIIEYTEGMSLASNATLDQASAIKELTKIYEDTSSEISILNELLEKSAQGKKISANEAMGYIAKVNELAEAISIENGQIKINEEAVRKLKDVKVSSFKSMSDSIIASVAITAQSIQTNINNYGKEISAIKDLASAKAALAKMDLQLNKQFDETGGYVDKKLLADWQEMQGIVKTIEMLEDLINTSTEGFNTVGTEAEKASKSNKKNSESLKESTYYTDEYKNAVAKLNLELDKLNQIKAKFSPHSKEYRKALEDEIKLTKQMMNLHKQQQSSLQSQISSGKFTPTGMVTKEVGTSSGKSSLSGWNGAITSNYGMRKHPVYGDQRMHHGVDIKFAQGSNLQSNVSGTVKSASFTSGGYGGLIEITDAQGRTHKYAHLNQINVKAGQQVNAGDIIAKTGGAKGTKGAGTSTGAHLHYEVRVNGQSINPIDFINQAKGMQVSTKNIGQAQADLAQSTDQARNEIISLDQEIIKLQETIDNLEIELINSRLSEFQFLREGADRNIQRSQQILEDYSMSSKMYRDELEKQNKQKRYQIDLYTKEAEYLRKQLEREDLSAKVKDELTVKLSEVVLAYHEYNAVIKENTKLIEDSLRLEQFTSKMEDLDYELQVSRGLMQFVNDESEEYTDHLIKQDKLLRQKIDINGEEIKRLSKLLATYREGTKQYEETKKLIRELTLESIGYNNELQNLLETTKKVAEEKLSKITDVERKVIEMIKHRINEEKKALQDNLKDYQSYWNEKIRILRKAHEDEDWDKSLQKEQELLSNLRVLYNKQMLDDSLESRNKQRQLLKQIQEQEEKIQDMLRKKALDKEIEGIEQLIKEEEDRTEEKLSELDKQLENDKLYIEARKAIESGYLKWYTVETKNIQGLVRREFTTTTKTLEDAYIEFENKFGEGMSILGSKIKSEFIASIKLAQQEIINLAKLIQETGININFDPYGLDIIGKDNVGGRPSGNLSNDNLNLMWAKFLNDKVMQDSKVKASIGSMKSFGKMKDTVVGFISDRSSTIDPRNLMNFDQAFATLEQDQKEQLLSFLRQKLLTEGRVEDKTNIGVVDSLLKHVARFNTGGGTGKWSGGHPKLAALDSEELILKTKDTNNFESLMDKLEFANNNILPNIKSAIPSTLNMIKQANPLQGIDLRFDNLIHVEGNIDSVTMPKVESAINSAFEKLNRTFNMNGVFRKI